MFRLPFNCTSFQTASSRIKRRTSHLTIVCMAGLMMVSCGDSSTSPEPDPDPEPPEEPRNVSYSEDIQPIFNTSCAVSGCHDSGTQESGVNLSSFDDAMSSEGIQYGESVINPGNPEDSPLVDKIEANPEIGARMPYQRDPLSQANIDSIRAWIDDGAPDN